MSVVECPELKLRADSSSALKRAGLPGRLTVFRHPARFSGLGLSASKFMILLANT